MAKENEGRKIYSNLLSFSLFSFLYSPHCFSLILRKSKNICTLVSLLLCIDSAHNIEYNTALSHCTVYYSIFSLCKCFLSDRDNYHFLMLILYSLWRSQFKEQENINNLELTPSIWNGLFILYVIIILYSILYIVAVRSSEDVIRHCE